MAALIGGPYQWRTAGMTASTTPMPPGRSGTAAASAPAPTARSATSGSTLEVDEELEELVELDELGTLEVDEALEELEVDEELDEPVEVVLLFPDDDNTTKPPIATITITTTAPMTAVVDTPRLVRIDMPLHNSR